MDEATFRTACGHFATGVSVVTMIDRAGEGHGLTVNSFASVSLNPPLVLVCVEKTITSHPAMLEAEGFLVNILTDQQERIARQFATPDVEKFAGIQTTPGPFGAPKLRNCLAYMAARTSTNFDGGDHTIFIGEATEAELGQGLPLIFYKGMYGLPSADSAL
ncbi:MAG TPA: flavin reductase family protein [Candidatus Dormibacteraeota bacterium]|jgi:flavin reductase (DIM6/NTAB) family NADH-FMN oxidoreductase RutF|nr:flavin reductase family protein [Candidatus Dormibacteraeota bacterium]